MKPIRKLSVMHFAAATLSLAMVLPAEVARAGADVTLPAVRNLTPWMALQGRLDQGGTVMLTDNVAATAIDDSLTVTNGVVLDLNGHTITGNGIETVIAIWEEGDLTLTNSAPSSGAIIGGYAEYGGGVYVFGGTFTMNGGAISGNSAEYGGGGVCVYEGGAFIMNGGAISGNEAENGGGVFMDENGVFTMNGGTIFDNVAGEYGGGVDLNGASFTMAGGTITENCSAFGGGVDLFYGVMEVTGSPVVSGNTNFVGGAGNVFLEQGQVLAVDGLSAGASIGVTVCDPAVFDTLAVTDGAAAGDSRYFFSDGPGIVVDERDGEVCFTAPRTPWQAVQAQLDQGGAVTLADDVSARTYDSSLMVTNIVLLDLAGHTLVGQQRDCVIYVDEGGTLTLTNSVEGAGVITGGYGGVYVVSGGTFTMNGGAISGNGPDGGVAVGGYGSAFTMNGGEISGNTTGWNGGGVFVNGGGTFTMNGGAISANQAENSGGGVFVYDASAFTMNGGEIFGNTAPQGGGVGVSDSTFTVSGNPVVSGNTNAVGEANNVYLPDGTVIAVDGLAAGASIGVTTEIDPSDAGCPVVLTTDAAAGDAAHFFSDDSGCHVEMVEGELCLVVGAGLPAYLDGANELVIANYTAWAAKYGPDVTGAHEAAFLLDIDPATPIPAGAALLKIVGFRVTATRLHIEIASDVTMFEEKETEFPMLGNGFLELLTAMSLSSDPDWVPSGPVPFEIRNGRAVIDQQGDYGNGQMPPTSFFKAAITPFFDDGEIGLEE